MAKQRRHYTAEEKVSILRRHLLEHVPVSKLCDELSLQPGEYFLYVSRLEPENNALLLVKAFERTSHRQKLVIVGDARYSDNYIRRLKQTQDPRPCFPLLFTGPATMSCHPALIRSHGAGLLRALSRHAGKPGSLGAMWAFAINRAKTRLFPR